MVLRPERTCGQPALQQPKGRKQARKENPENRSRAGEPSRIEATSHLARINHHGVFIERAVPHRVAGQRVQRGVLKQKEAPAGGKHARYLAQQGDVLIGRNVMEHARRIGEIEMSVGMGIFRPSKARKVAAPGKR